VMSWLADRRLLRAARRGDSDSIQGAVRTGARVDATGRQGLTPLMLAANYGHCDAMRRLVELGAGVNCTSDVFYPGHWSDFTPLMAACCDSTGEVEPVALLIQLGANPQAKDNLGRTASDYARLSGYSAIEEFLAGLAG
jgi:ankyrin repeat protein